MFFLPFLEALALTSALSADAFVSAFAYGTDKVKIRLKSCAVISIICTAMLTAALTVGDLASDIIPIESAVWISFFIFLIIGSIKLMSPIIKKIKKRTAPLPSAHSLTEEELQTVALGENSLPAERYPNDRIGNTLDNNLNLLNPLKRRSLSLPQSMLLAIALSLDGLGIGFGAGLNAPNFSLIIILSLITNGVALALGAFLGNKISNKIRFSLSWLSGVVLIAIGISNLLF